MIEINSKILWYTTQPLDYQNSQEVLEIAGKLAKSSENFAEKSKS